MLPELFQIGPFPIRSFGLFMALAFLGGVLYLRHVARRDKRPFDHLLNIAYIMIFAGVIGARIWYVITHWGDYAANPISAINPFGNSGSGFGIAGLNLYGGLVLALVSTFIYCRRNKLNVLDIFDVFAPSYALGTAIARWGCFCNGCCFGKPTDLPWGVTFPPDSLPAHIYGAVAVHPTQIYSSLYGLILFLVCGSLLKKRQFIGQVAGVMLMGEALSRYLIDLFRWYEEDMLFPGLSDFLTWNQATSIGLFLLGVLIYLFGKRMHSDIKTRPA